MHCGMRFDYLYLICVISDSAGHKVLWVFKIRGSHFSPMTCLYTMLGGSASSDNSGWINSTFPRDIILSFPKEHRLSFLKSVLLIYFPYQAKLIASVIGERGVLNFIQESVNCSSAIIVNQLYETNHIIFTPPGAQFLLFKRCIFFNL